METARQAKQQGCRSCQCSGHVGFGHLCRHLSWKFPMVRCSQALSLACHAHVSGGCGVHIGLCVCVKHLNRCKTST